MTQDELTLRKWLWLSHGCQGLYGDDGEMQCAACRLDFKRDSVDRIDQVFKEKVHERMVKHFRENKLTP